MRDYYDRLEEQLSELTAQGAHRRRRVSVALPRVRLRARFGNLVALAASGVIVVAVAAALFAVRAGHHRPYRSPAVGHGGPPVLRNIYPARVPAPSGQLISASRLVSPSGRKAPVGEVRFYAASPTLTKMVVTAAGLRKETARDVYAVWLLPADVFSVTGGAVTQLHPGVPPELLGVIEPAVGRSGHVTIVRLLHEGLVGGPNKLEIAVQPRSSVTVPGRVVLQRFVNF